MIGIIGLDPGTKAFGWAFVTAPAPEPNTYNWNVDIRFVCAGMIYPKSKAIANRATEVFDAVETTFVNVSKIVATNKNDVVCDEMFASVEQGFLKGKRRNFVSLSRLAEIRGAALVAIGRANVSLIEVTPANAKKAITGNGLASKETVARFLPTRVQGLTTDDVAGMTPDECDAVAIAVAGFNKVVWEMTTGGKTTCRRTNRTKRRTK